MGVSDWKIIYRSYNGDELDAEIASIKQGLKGGFTSQGSGSVSHTRDTTDLRDRLRAATEVKSERSGTAAPRQATVDFSNSRTEDF